MRTVRWSLERRVVSVQRRTVDSLIAYPACPGSVPAAVGPACLVAVSEAMGGWSGGILNSIGLWTEEEDCSMVEEVRASHSDYLADRATAHRLDAVLGTSDNCSYR